MSVAVQSYLAFDYGLKRVGVPTELFMYPGASHGIPDARNRLVKSTAAMDTLATANLVSFILYHSNKND